MLFASDIILKLCCKLLEFIMAISLMLQVVMPTVEADVAFGLGKYSLTREEVKFRVSKALDAVGMLNYQQVDYAHARLLCSNN